MSIALRSVAITLMLSSVLAFAGEATASDPTRRHGVAVHGVIGYGQGYGYNTGDFGLGGFGVGAGVRYVLPLLQEGLLANLDDSVEAELGADYTFSRTGNYIAVSHGHRAIIPAEARWTLHVTPVVSAYLKGSVGLQLWYLTTTMSGGVDLGSATHAGVYLAAAAGGTYRMGGMLLRLEVGTSGLRAGVIFEI